MLPVPYFQATLTAPEELRPVSSSNQKILYELLMWQRAHALLDGGRDHKNLDDEPGCWPCCKSGLATFITFHMSIAPFPAACSRPTALRWVRPTPPNYVLPQGLTIHPIR